MRRYDTFTRGVKTAFFHTFEIAEHNGASRFVCEAMQYSLPCKYCPFDNSDIHKMCLGIRARTASEWLAWAEEEVEDEKN